MTPLGTTLPLLSFNSFLTVIISSIPLVPTSQHPSFNPFALPPFRITSSSIIPCFSHISDGRLSCLFEERRRGRLRKREVVVKRLERWERECDTEEVCG
jgi:hypothetical protein